MLLVVCSSSDPELELLRARPGVALVVPAHLSQPGWFYELGRGARARLVTSRGVIAGGDVSAVLTRTQRAWPSDLPHIDQEDREYVATEMTAFLSALLNELACPLFNRPTANSWWGPPWTREHWWRAASREGFPVCTNPHDLCAESQTVLVLGDEVMSRDKGLPEHACKCVLRLAELANVRLLEARFCCNHQALQRISLRPPLDDDLLAAIEQQAMAAGASL